MNVDAGKDFRVGFGALRFGFRNAVNHILPPLAQDEDDVKRAAGCSAHQHQFHGPRAEIAAACVGCSIDDDGMSAAAFRNETDPFIPLDSGFHGIPEMAARERRDQ
jgi:hypothetical protein